MSVFIDSERGLARVTLWGVQSVDEIMDELERLLSHPSFRPGMSTLWDLRGASLRALSQSEMRRIARLAAARVPGGGNAYGAVLVMGDADFGSARMFELLTEAELPVKLRVFQDAREAEAWLDRATCEKLTESEG